MMDDIDRSLDWWHAALTGARGPIDGDNPKAGFYRAKAKDKSMSAVAIWYDTNTGELRYQDNGRDVEEMKARERWPYVSKNPISEETFWHFKDCGAWLDIDEAAYKNMFSRLSTFQPSEDTGAAPESIIAQEISAAKESAAKYAKVESDEEMVLGQSLRAKLQELGGKADKLRTEEKEPHLLASREVDAKWQPMIKTAKAAADGIRKSMEAWNDFKLQQQYKAQSAGQPTNAPLPSAQIAGGGGRAASVAVKTIVTDIDIDLAFQHFRADHNLRVCLTDLAQKDVDAGIAVPGATVEKRSAIR